MDILFSTIPGIIMSIGGLLAISAVGVSYFMGLFKKNNDNEDDRLIKILEGTVNALEKKVDDQKIESDKTIKNLTAKIDSLTRKIINLENENETLVKVLQGRDEVTRKFYEASFKSMETTEMTHALVLKIAEKI